jgi:prepilin peptidase dependent protein B
MKNASLLQVSTAQRGLSLIEMMVAVAIGLIVIAAALNFFNRHLRESRAAQLELRLMQDLRSVADLIGRDLRRAGHWGNAGAGVWQREAQTLLSNPYAFVTIASHNVAFNFSRDDADEHAENNTVDTNEQFGFRLRAGVVEFLLGNGYWQALSDANTVTITSFTVTPSVQHVSLEGMCATACSATDSASATCPPQQHLRSLNIALTGQAVTDAKVKRSVQNQVRLRNDAITGRCSL